MTRLGDLVQRLGGSCRVPSDGGPEIRDVKLDSRRVRAGDLFVALPGTRRDGMNFVSEAVARGAGAVLLPHLDRGFTDELGDEFRPWVHPQARRIAGRAAALVHGEPASELFTIAVTGTNGKTTTAHLIGELMRADGRRPAVLGTTGYRLADGSTRRATHTTPDSPELQRLVRTHRDLGGDALVLEASSHALEQERLSGLDIDVAVFTNLSREHLDYHGDLESYASAKARLFECLDSSGVAVINADSPEATRMSDTARAQGARVITYSTRSSADLCASRLSFDLLGTELSLHGMGIAQTKLRFALSGRYNVENALAAAAAVLVAGASPSTVVEGLASVSHVPGRLEPVPTGERDFTLLVDYAHTEAALSNVCQMLRKRLDEPASPGLEQCPKRGRLLLVFGCGGERDRGKRGPMGRVANALADVAVITSDNPRAEDPDRIINDILEGMQPNRPLSIVEPDRRLAIQRAIDLARPGDVLLIAGKGHETTQVLGSHVVPFDDRQVAIEALR